MSAAPRPGLPGLVAWLAAVALVPLSPLLPRSGLDDSWAFGMNAAVAAGLRLGRDVIFTFGPYAAAYTQLYHPATDGLMLGASSLMAAALAAGLLALTRERHRWSLAPLLLLLPLPLARPGALSFTVDAVGFALPALHLALAARLAEVGRPAGRGEAAALLLLGAVLGLLPLVKISFSLAALAALLLGTLALLSRGRRREAGLALLAAAATLPVAWALSGQSLADLPAYAASQPLIVAGYSEAMGEEGPAWQLAAALAALALLLLAQLPGALARGLPGLCLLAGAAACLLLALKAGFTRQDSHVAATAGALLLVGWVLWLGRQERAAAAGLAAGLAGFLLLHPAAAPGWTPLAQLRDLPGVHAGALRGLASRLLDPDALPRAYEARLAEIRAERPLPVRGGTADIYSHGQSHLLAHGAAWNPRPVFQSYSAYNAALIRRNAEHLLGPEAPDTVYLAVEPVDGRPPALEDGPSWPILLARYEAEAILGRTVVLRRSTEPAEAPRPGPPLLAGRAALGEWVPVPTGQGPVWAAIRVPPTALGRLAALALRTSPLAIRLRRPDGRVVERRLVPAMSAEGFLLSPMIEDAESFLALALPGPGLHADLAPVAFSVTETGWGRGLTWAGTVEYELRPLALPARPSAHGALLATPRPAPPAPPGESLCSLDELDGRRADHARPLPVGEAARLVGWGFLELRGGLEPEEVHLVLTAPDGTARRAPARLLPRPDVGLHHGRPHLARVGFHALLDLSGLSGPHRLGLEMAAGGERRLCGLGAGPVTLPGGAPGFPATGGTG